VEPRRVLSCSCSCENIPRKVSGHKTCLENQKKSTKVCKEVKRKENYVYLLLMFIVLPIICIPPLLCLLSLSACLLSALAPAGSSASGEARGETSCGKTHCIVLPQLSRVSLLEDDVLLKSFRDCDMLRVNVYTKQAS